MATSTINTGLKRVVLANWIGNSKTSGTITLNDNIYNYDYIIFYAHTNAQMYQWMFNPKVFNLLPLTSRTISLSASSDPSTTASTPTLYYNSQLDLTSISTTSNSTTATLAQTNTNQNWALKLDYVEGIKLG